MSGKVQKEIMKADKSHFNPFLPGFCTPTCSAPIAWLQAAGFMWCLYGRHIFHLPRLSSRGPGQQNWCLLAMSFRFWAAHGRHYKIPQKILQKEGREDRKIVCDFFLHFQGPVHADGLPICQITTFFKFEDQNSSDRIWSRKKKKLNESPGSGWGKFSEVCGLVFFLDKDDNILPTKTPVQQKHHPATPSIGVN